MSIELTLRIVDMEWAYAQPLIDAGLVKLDETDPLELEDSKPSVNALFALEMLVGWKLVRVDELAAPKSGLYLDLTWESCETERGHPWNMP